MSGERRRGVDGDDSLLASVAGVPLTRMARIAVCMIWAGFWAARVLLTDALAHFNPLNVRAVFSELLGPEPVDQAFSICMIWLSVEVAIIAKDTVEAGVQMLIAKTPIGLKRRILRGLTEGLSPEELEAMAARIRRDQQEKAAKSNGKQG